jgi:hypothetical protein
MTFPATALAVTTVGMLARDSARNHPMDHPLMMMMSPTTTPLTVTGGAAQPKTTSSLAESFYKLPGPLRYFISGNFGNVLFYISERFLHACLHLLWTSQHQSDATTAMPSWTESATFFSAYMLHVPG